MLSEDLYTPGAISQAIVPEPILGNMSVSDADSIFTDIQCLIATINANIFLPQREVTGHRRPQISLQTMIDGVPGRRQNDLKLASSIEARAYILYADLKILTKILEQSGKCTVTEIGAPNNSTNVLISQIRNMTTEERLSLISDGSINIDHVSDTTSLAQQMQLHSYEDIFMQLLTHVRNNCDDGIYDEMSKQLSANKFSEDRVGEDQRVRERKIYKALDYKVFGEVLILLSNPSDIMSLHRTSQIAYCINRGVVSPGVLTEDTPEEQIQPKVEEAYNVLSDNRKRFFNTMYPWHQTEGSGSPGNQTPV